MYGINPISALLWGLGTLLIVGAVIYDRWHDGLWPFHKRLIRCPGPHGCMVHPSELDNGSTCCADDTPTRVVVVGDELPDLCNRLALVRGVPVACDEPYGHLGPHKPALGEPWVEADEDADGRR